MRKVLSLVVVGILVGCYIWLVAWFLGTQSSSQQVPLFIAAISSLISALGVLASWQVVIEMRRDREAFYRPEVYADFKVLDGLFVFTVYNAGRSTAKQVKIDVQPIPIGREDKPIDNVRWLKEPITALLPGQKLEKVVDSHIALLDENSNRPKNFRIQIEYTDLNGTKYTEGPYFINLEDFRNSRFLPLPEDEALTRISDRLNDIQRILSSLRRT